MLLRIPRYNSLDLEDSMEYLEDPYEFTVTYPFGRHITAQAATPEKPSGPSQKEGSKKPKKKAATQQKGRSPVHSSKAMKYGPKNIPKYLKHKLAKTFPLGQKMANKFWKKAFFNLEACALASSTWKKYISALNAYQQFCTELNLSHCWPLSDSNKLGFIVWCKEVRGLLASTAKSYLMGLRTLSNLMGYKNSEGLNPLEKLLLKGMENSKDLKNPNTKKTKLEKSDPLTFHVLKSIRKALKQKKWKHSSRLNVWAACCTGYFGAFRAGELLTKLDWSFDKFSDLLWKDIWDSPPNSLKIHVKKPKTGTPGGEWIELFRTPNKKFCPVSAIKKLKSSQSASGIWTEDLPVFRFESGKNLTVKNLTKILRKTLLKTKFRDKNITAKSLRAGIPSDMENRPDLLNDFHLKNWGRWKGKSYMRYMKSPSVSKKWIFDRICQAIFKK